MAKSKKQKIQRLAAKRQRQAIKRKQAKARIKQFTDHLGIPNLPIHQTLLSDWENDDSGMTTAVFSRRYVNNEIAIGMFLIDRFCLGVKDAFLRIASHFDYENLLNDLRENQALHEVAPACVVKMVLESVAYADELGFPPHRDYRKASKVFGNVDPAECPTEFEFGKDGKPLYIAGPYDSEQKRNQIMAHLERRVGRDGFHFLMPVGPDTKISGEVEMMEDDIDDDDEHEMDEGK